MYITGVPDHTLMVIGRWRSLGFMVYIKHQISSFSASVSVRLIQKPWFTISKHASIHRAYQAPIRNSSWPQTYPFDRATSFFLPPDQKYIWPPERLTIIIYDQKTFQITQSGFIWNLPVKLHLATLNNTHSSNPVKSPKKTPRNTPFTRKYPQTLRWNKTFQGFAHTPATFVFFLMFLVNV